MAKCSHLGQRSNIFYLEKGEYSKGLTSVVVAVRVVMANSPNKRLNSSSKNYVIKLLSSAKIWRVAK